MEAVAVHASFSSYSPPVVAGGRDDAGSSRSMSRLPARVAGAVARGIVTFVFATGRWWWFLASFCLPRLIRARSVSWK
jgi:hypothetical protein